MARQTCAVAQACGGCPLIESSLGAQRELKTARVLETFRESSQPPLDVQWVASPRAEGYRNRVRMRLDHGVPRFFNEHKIKGCVVLSPSLSEAITRFEDWASRHGRLLHGYSHIELREADLDGSAGLEIAAAAHAPRAADGGTSLQNELRRDPPPGFECWIRGSCAPPRQRFEIVPSVYTYVPLGSFRQVNAGLNARMIQTLRAWLDALGSDGFGDVYCGSGNLSLPLLACGQRGWGVERDVYAIDALCQAAREQGLGAGEFVAGDAAQVIRSADVLLIDPPRAGMGHAAAIIEQIRPHFVVLFSCSNRGLRRDLQMLCAAGYRPLQVALCDMFVHTEHLEVMTLLGRPAGAC